MASKRGEVAAACLVVGVLGLVFVAHAKPYEPPKPTVSHIPYRPATEREKLDHDLKQAWEKDRIERGQR